MKVSLVIVIMVIITIIILLASILCALDVPLVGRGTLHHHGDLDDESLSSVWNGASIPERTELLAEIAGQDWDISEGMPPHDATLVVLHNMSKDDVINFLGKPDDNNSFHLTYRLEQLEQRDLCDIVRNRITKLDSIRSYLCINFDEHGRVKTIMVIE